ncbi:MAG: murein L,D-transpeptidase catalytic domain-containing protein, partial [Bacteroidia bacterium]
MDLTTHSGNYRFFGVDLSTKDTVLSALVAHGHCKTTDHRLAQFSNEVGS